MPKLQNELHSLGNIPIVVLSDSMDSPLIEFGKHHVLDATHTELHLVDLPIYKRVLTVTMWSGYDSMYSRAGSGYYAYRREGDLVGIYFIESVAGTRKEDFRSCESEELFGATITMRRAG